MDVRKWFTHADACVRNVPPAISEGDVMVRGARQTVAALVVLSLGVAACGNSSDDDADTPAAGGESRSGPVSDAERDTFESISGVPGVTDDEISYAVIGVEANNPLGTCVLDCYLAGVQAYFDYRNAEGGIFGRELAVGPVLDDEVAQNQARALEVTSSDEVFGAFNAPLVASGFADLDEAGVPTYSWGIHGAEAADRQAIFPSIAPLCAACVIRAVPYAAEHLGASRVASLGYGIQQSSKDCATTSAETIETYRDDVGAESVYVNDDIEFGMPNGIAPEVTAMKEDEVDLVVGCLDLNGMKTLAEEMERQGMGDVPMFHPNTYNQQFVRDAGDLFEGDIVLAQFLPFEAERTESLDQFLTAMEESGEEPSELAMVGWINADEAYTSLLAAGPEFDRESVIAGMNSLTDYDAGGLINPIDWTRQHAIPDGPTNGYAQECHAMVEVVDGEFQTVAPSETPWLCWSGDDASWAEPVPTSFAD
jgi:branched-chain amino acid transport system substrate-binding protein